MNRRRIYMVYYIYAHIIGILFCENMYNTQKQILKRVKLRLYQDESNCFVLHYYIITFITILIIIYYL